MAFLLQVDFPYSGPWGQDMTTAMTGLAQSIAQEPGLVWNIWTENQEEGRAGGVYLFSDRASAEAYLAMHTERLRGFGVAEVSARIDGINPDLSRIDRAPF